MTGQYKECGGWEGGTCSPSTSQSLNQTSFIQRSQQPPLPSLLYTSTLYSPRWLTSTKTPNCTTSAPPPVLLDSSISTSPSTGLQRLRRLACNRSILAWRRSWKCLENPTQGLWSICRPATMLTSTTAMVTVSITVTVSSGGG